MGEVYDMASRGRTSKADWLGWPSAVSVHKNAHVMECKSWFAVMESWFQLSLPIFDCLWYVPCGSFAQIVVQRPFCDSMFLKAVSYVHLRSVWAKVFLFDQKLEFLTFWFRYSYDEGETWNSYTFIDNPKIRVYGLLTEPEETTTVFSIFGSLANTTSHSWVVIQVDLRSVLGKCILSVYYVQQFQV